MLPEDPMMLLSYVNTQLRDFYADFAAFCADQEIDAEKVEEKLRGIDYEYDKKLNRFV